MTISEAVKSTVTPRMAAEHFGLKIGRNGMVCCPFRNDRHPSLFVTDDHYHCFACGEHGDVIDFVAKLFDLSLHDAAKKLAYDFGIQTDKPPTKAMQEKQHRKTEAQRLRETEKLCFSALLAYLHLLEDWKACYAPNPPGDEMDSRFTKACHNLPQVEYWVELLLSGDSYERGDADNVLLFLRSDGYIRLKADSTIASADQYAIYCIWCNDNTYKPLAARTVSMTLKKHADEFGLEHDNHITNSLGKQVDGFWGIEALISPGIL